MRTTRIRKMAAVAAALRRECAPRRTLFLCVFSWDCGRICEGTEQIGVFLEHPTVQLEYFS